jgi:hypothetical protein
MVQGGIRVDELSEVQGLDIHEMGTKGYEWGDYPTGPEVSPAPLVPAMGGD